MQRTTPEYSIKETYKVQGLGKLTDKQKGLLAEKNLVAETVFSVPVVQFGAEVQAAVAKEITKIIDKLTAVQIANGCPAEVAQANGEHVKANISLYGGMSEAVKAYGIKSAGLPSDFFGAAGPVAGVVEKVSVKL